MDNKTLRDRLLIELFQRGQQYSHFSDLRKKFEETPVDRLQEALSWLARRDFIWANDTFPGEISTVRISERGEDVVEDGGNVIDFCRRHERGNVINQQWNVNSGNSVNALGDNNVFQLRQENHSAIESIAQELRKANYTEQADELEQLEKKKGAKEALRKVLGWIDSKFFSEPVLAAITPHAIGAAADIL